MDVFENLKQYYGHSPLVDFGFFSLLFKVLQSFKYLFKIMHSLECKRIQFYPVNLALLLVKVTTPNSYNEFGIYHYIGEYVVRPTILALNFGSLCFHVMKFHNIIEE